MVLFNLEAWHPAPKSPQNRQNCSPGRQVPHNWCIPDRAPFPSGERPLSPSRGAEAAAHEGWHNRRGRHEIHKVELYSAELVVCNRRKGEVKLVSPTSRDSCERARPLALSKDATGPLESAYLRQSLQGTTRNFVRLSFMRPRRLYKLRGPHNEYGRSNLAERSSFWEPEGAYRSSERDLAVVFSGTGTKL